MIRYRYDELPSGPWTHNETQHIFEKEHVVFDPFSGKIFIHGFPLGCLPDNCLNHRHYKDYLGDQLFEVYCDPGPEIVTYKSAATTNLEGVYSFIYNAKTSPPFDNNNTIDYNGHKYEFIDDPFNIIHQKLIQPICSAFDKLEKVLNSNNSCVLTFYFYNREQDDPYWSYIVNFNEKTFFHASIKVDDTTDITIKHIFKYGQSHLDYVLYSTNPCEFIWPYKPRKFSTKIDKIDGLDTELPIRSLETRTDFLYISLARHNDSNIYRAVPKWVATNLPGFIYADNVRLLQFWNYSLPETSKTQFEKTKNITDVIDVIESAPENPVKPKLKYRISTTTGVIYKPEEDLTYLNLFNKEINNTRPPIVDDFNDLLKFEDINFIVLEQCQNDTIELKFSRFGLTFSRDNIYNNHYWVSREFPGYFITKQPTI